ncbi:serine hydrolase [Deinococcus roseus]|uniref:Beta-lactamase class A catalytic domain-containing protein n=1 Tax=Deinococcus roseus TaxID=392414 RepID=A0ABQ2D392_9DEIO|nr:serine hydrolase [Deinococcus roseus]GGJ44173.1 hypothetical protein GCM10008938_33050 [Deinococcus roseus]
MLSTTYVSRFALITLSLAVTTAQAAPRIGEHADHYRIVFDLPTKTTVHTASTPTSLTFTLPGLALPSENRSLGILNLGYRQGGTQIVLTGSVQGSTVSTLDNTEEGMRLIIDVPKTEEKGEPVEPVTPAPPPPPVAKSSTTQLNSACLDNDLPVVAAPKPPALLTGRIGLFVAELDPKTLRPSRAVAYNADQEFPLASSYKQVVLYDILQDVDAGKYTLDSTLTTTEALRSLQAYPEGSNTIRQLADRAIRLSDNTANDMLHHATGILHPQQTADNMGLCNTRLLLTTKAWWTAQAGLGGKYFPKGSLLKSAQAFGSANRASQITMAQDLVQTSMKVNADKLLVALDGKEGYFLNRYDPRIDLNTQNKSTPREFTALVTLPFRPGRLSKSSLQFYKSTYAKGCCQPATLPFPVNYWGSKSGSGWRLLALTGYLELPNGKKFAYTYFNHESKVANSVSVKAQAPTVLKWITEAIDSLR